MQTTTSIDPEPLVWPTPKGIRTYDVIEHRNSRRSYKNGTAAHNHRKGLNHFTYQVIRRLGGMPLPHFPTPPSRSKYAPHVGAKQIAKLS